MFWVIILPNRCAKDSHKIFELRVDIRNFFIRFFMFVFSRAVVTYVDLSRNWDIGRNEIESIVLCAVLMCWRYRFVILNYIRVFERFFHRVCGELFKMFVVYQIKTLLCCHCGFKVNKHPVLLQNDCLESYSNSCPCSRSLHPHSLHSHKHLRLPIVLPIFCALRMRLLQKHFDLSIKVKFLLEVPNMGIFPKCM